MARITYVKRAQQRYKMVPVVDATTGAAVRVGVDRATKSGRAVTRAVTERDYSQPLPMPKCDKCTNTIEVGMPYKWIEPHGRGQMTRCMTCPNWHEWEYSNSTSARIGQIQYEADFEGCESEEDFKGVLESAATSARELAEEKRESAGNIEDGFGHSTSQSDELNELADALDSWADDLEGIDFPDIEDEPDTGPTDEQLETWRGEVREACEAAVNDCPGF